MAVYADLAEALANGATKDQLMEIMYQTDQNKSLHGITPESLAAQRPLPPGWNKQKVADVFDKNRKSFRKYFSELGLQKFSGTEDTIPFQAWWQAFCRQVHVLPETYASDSDKVWALGQLLTGEPANIVKGWISSEKPNAYTESVITLQSKYGDNEKARHKLKTQLNEMKPTSMKVKALSNFLANINTIRLNLTFTGMSDYQASDEAMSAVIHIMAVPHVTQYLQALGIYGKTTPSSFYTSDPSKYFVDFMQWFLQSSRYVTESDDEDDSGITSDYSMVMATRTQTETKKPEVKSSKPQSVQKGNNPGTPSRSNPRPPLQRVFICVFCKKNHKNDYCTHDVSTRITIAERLNLCRCCLKTGHRQDECSSDNTCCYCAKKGLWRQHNTALCNSPKALAARMQGLKLDWNEYRKSKRNDPNYAKYKAQLLKKRLERTPKELRAQMAQILIECMSSDDEDDVPVSLESSTDATSNDNAAETASESTEENND